MVGETNRAPFDLPEAEGELVGGFHTEYCSLKFALFFLAEYINMVTVSALATTLFLGGWRAPWPISLWSGANTGWWPLLWFFGKVLVFIFVFIWLRGTLPRMRYDQFMKLGWKVLIPVSLVWIVAVAAVRVYRVAGRRPVSGCWSARPWSLAVLVVLYLFLPEPKPARREDDAGVVELDRTRTARLDDGATTRTTAAARCARAAARPRRPVFAGGYPVPPMPEKSPAPGAAATTTEEPTGV